MRRLCEEILCDAIEEDNLMEEQRPVLEPIDNASNSSSSFLAVNDISVPFLSASMAPSYRGSQRVQILHKGIALKLICDQLKVRFGISTKFADQTGRPRLSFVVDAPPNLCQVLDACDNHAQRLFMQSGSTSEWRPVLSRKNGYWNFPTVQLHIPTVITGNVALYGTDIFQKEASSGIEQKLVFSVFNASELESLFTPGTFAVLSWLWILMTTSRAQEFDWSLRNWLSILNYPQANHTVVLCSYVILICLLNANHTVASMAN